MKKILLALFTFLSLLINAQLDTDHWFAPMSASAGTSGLQSFLYLSTNESSPFQVQIFNNNNLYNTVTISKGNPAQVSIPANFLLATNQGDLFTPVPMGMFVKGSKKFFANYRFSVSNHAEIITSKGLAGLGTTFYAAMAPNTAANDWINATIGITATEDNTTVIVSGYDPQVLFSDGTSSPTKTFTLNRGQSYIIDAVSTHSTHNWEGLIGAKITATKPVSVTNGNFNAIYTNQNFTNNDILMDQAVPVDRLGKDFVIVKGNGPATSGMETILVIATENNTTFTVNGVASGVNLHAGEYYLIPGNSYINQGNNNFNMGVSSNKNMYVYQLLAGVATGTIYATGGFNYIPPLSCFLPNKVDEIGMINRIGNTTYNTKLNIITQSGATVTLNGNSIAAANGPYQVTGNPNWVSYSVPNITGNVTVSSTKSVTAGIIGGSGAVGYGGYFAGFSSVPVITKTGDCYAGILLQVDNTYDGYQWYLNGTIIPGAVTYSINPELYGTGNYTCSVTKNNCETKLTPVYTYTLCPPISTTTYNIGSCNTKIINPAFTNSFQTIIPAQTAIITSPASGTALINPTNGQITYTPNPGLTSDTTDNFIYYIQGSGNPADFEYFKVIINTDVLQINNAALTTCTSNGNTGIIDLTTAIVTLDSGTSSAYFSNAALTTQITTPSAYVSNSGIVYVKVTSAFGCSKTAQINLTVNSGPNINTGVYNADICDDDYDGMITINFTAVTSQIVSNSAGFTVKYYLSQADATSGNTNILPVNWTYSSNTTVYVRVESINGCPPAFGQIDFKIKSKVPLLTTNQVLEICDTDNNGFETVNLNNYTNVFTTDPLTAVTFHSTLADAQAGINAVSSTQTINNGATGTYYLRFTNTAYCFNTGNLSVKVNAVPNINTTNFNANICDDNFDGSININFNSVTPQITVNLSNFTVKYYLNQTDATAGNTNTLPVNWTYTSNTTVYVRAEGTGTCPPAFGQINFTIGSKISLITNTISTQVCDNNLNGVETVNLSDYKNLFTTDPGVILTFHSDLASAQAGTNPISAQQIITNSGIFYIRFTSNNACPNTGKLTVTLKSGKKSDILRDQIICTDNKAFLDAGAGFTSYLWSTGATTQSITAVTGNYFVDLTFNGCIYRQTVTVTAVQSPIITSIQVSGSNATVNVTGGNAPYRYSLNGMDYQSSNTFSGLSRGTYKVYVLSKDGCMPVTRDFIILNLVNTITPNGDGHNDTLNYSELRLKENVSIEVVDRYGSSVYRSKGKNYVWNGKSEGRLLSTGTYWYILKWTEPDTKLPVSYSGWLLIRNRE